MAQNPSENIRFFATDCMTMTTRRRKDDPSPQCKDKTYTNMGEKDAEIHHQLRRPQKGTQIF